MSRNSLKNVCRLINEQKKQEPIEKQFVQDLKRSIELNDKKDSRQSSNYYKPSSLHCIRNMFYQRKGIKGDAESTATLIGICESGTDRHLRIQEAVSRMKENDMDCEYIDVAGYICYRDLQDLDIIEQCGFETKLFNKKLLMRFLCDGIIRYKGKYYILEIKTESTYKWTSRNGVADEHKNQATAYALNFWIDSVLFLYINRDTCDMKAYMYTPTNEEKFKLKNMLIECEDYVEKDVLPDKSLGISSKICSYCDYRELCQLDRKE